MTTRLERLWMLLDQGSSPVIRKVAADQVGEILDTQPAELQNLLNKVSRYLRSKNWHTRVAAGQAVESMIRHTKLWNPPCHEHEECMFAWQRRAFVRPLCLLCLYIKCNG
jgi:TATA-binding protein-associated factor